MRIQDKTLEELRHEIELLINCLRISFPVHFIERSKMATKVDMLRNAILLAVKDLANANLIAYDNNHFVPAMILSRSLLERVAFLFYLYDLVNSSINAGNIRSRDNDLYKLLLGSKDGRSNQLDALNILTCVDKISKCHSNIRGIYDDLSEFAHPNYNGLLYSYIELNDKELFYKSKNQSDSSDLTDIKSQIILSLRISLNLFRIYYDKLADILPKYEEMHYKEMPTLQIT